MRKLMIILWLLPLTVAGQLSGGFFGGLNVSKLRGDTPKDVYFLNLPNGDIGLFLDYQVKDMFVVCFQPYLTRKGTKVSYRVEKELDPVDTAKIFLSAISFPLALKVRTNNEHWYVLGGVEVSRRLRSYYEYINGPSGKVDIGDQVADINVYLSFGAGYRHVVAGKYHLFGEIRYFQALINIIRSGIVDPVEMPRVRSRGFQLLVGMEFPLYRKKKENR